MREKQIWCCGCRMEVPARLTDGREVYPHRRDLADLPFWRCDACSGFIGCHHKTADRTRPLGVIPTREIKSARQHIHRILDPIWKRGKMSRGAVYAEIAKRMGWAECHTADIRTLGDARLIYAHVVDIRKAVASPERRYR